MAKEPEIVYRYKREEWYGLPSKYWLGGGLLVTVLICVYLAMKVYGNKSPNNNQQNNNQANKEESQSELPLNQNGPPMPTGGIPYSPDHNRPRSLANSPVSTNIENMNKRDLINNVPVFSSHLAQFESQYQPLQRQQQEIQVQEATPESLPQRQPSTRTVSSDSSPEHQTRATESDNQQLPNNKEGGGEGVPLPPVDYSAYQEDAF